MSNPNNLAPGTGVVYWDDEGTKHEAVVIDEFDRPNGYGSYINVVFNPSETEFGANTLDDLEDDTSVPHRIDAGSKERTYTTEWV